MHCGGGAPRRTLRSCRRQLLPLATPLSCSCPCLLVGRSILPAHQAARPPTSLCAPHATVLSFRLPTAPQAHAAGLATAHRREARLPSGLALWRRRTAAAAATEQALRLGAFAAVVTALRQLQVLNIVHADLNGLHPFPIYMYMCPPFSNFSVLVYTYCITGSLW